MQEKIIRELDEHKCLLTKRKQLERHFHGKCKEWRDLHRGILVVRELLRRIETTIKEKSKLMHTLYGRIERTKRDRDEARDDFEAEPIVLQSGIGSLKLDIGTVSAKSESFREKFHERESR